MAPFFLGVNVSTYFYKRICFTGIGYLLCRLVEREYPIMVRHFKKGVLLKNGLILMTSIWNVC